MEYELSYCNCVGVEVKDDEHILLIYVSPMSKIVDKVPNCKTGDKGNALLLTSKAV